MLAHATCIPSNTSIIILGVNINNEYQCQTLESVLVG